MNEVILLKLHVFRLYKCTEMLLSITLHPFHFWRNGFVYPLGRRSSGFMNNFGGMTKRNIAASVCVAQYESFSAV
jgi:hypothetical protein